MNHQDRLLNKSFVDLGKMPDLSPVVLDCDYATATDHATIGGKFYPWILPVQMKFRVAEC